MRWSVRQLTQNVNEATKFEETVDLSSTILDRSDDLIAIKPAAVNGWFVPEAHGLLADFIIEVEVTMPSSRSLKPVDVVIETHVTERYLDPRYITADMNDGFEVVLPLQNDLLDLRPAVEDAILLALPLQVLSADEQHQTATLPSGVDWAVITEDDYLHEQQESLDKSVDPRLQKLKELLDDGLND
ncbi:YceD family protein [Atopobacter phocae]|uniref:YceD family protein n=1 Tax=Atopobacter phocae TaxID=136492 RepID=UPI0005582EDE|nr:YceD family protein [Atopobacter phocae]